MNSTDFLMHAASKRSRKTETLKGNDERENCGEPDGKSHFPAERDVMKFVFIMTYVSIAVIAVSAPLLAFLPEGPFASDGMFNFISNGFEKHSSIASFIYGIGTMFIGMCRFLAVIVYVLDSNKAILCCFLIVLCQGTGILTTRIDEVQSMHQVVAGTCLITCIVFQAVVITFNKKYSDASGGGRRTKVIWGITVITGMVFIIMVATGIWLQNTEFRLLTGVAGYFCAEFILVNDFLMTLSLSTTFFWYE